MEQGTNLELFFPVPSFFLYFCLEPLSVGNFVVSLLDAMHTSFFFIVEVSCHMLSAVCQIFEMVMEELFVW